MAKVKVFIKLKDGVLDPQGKAVRNSLLSLGFENVEDVRVGKYIEVKVNEDNSEKAKQEVNEMCKKLLANPVIENYEIEVNEK
ncbi:MAG: phosphoribosylformylglycinamidine synthase subunit PurS [Candidatus Schekmanbacteria bacterium]|nr:MAG: phosphoribosylformylglycinamidine synthase subunit PurS [Candidatus Schekmanbacteria bacterium]